MYYLFLAGSGCQGGRAFFCAGIRDWNETNRATQIFHCLPLQSGGAGDKGARMLEKHFCGNAGEKHRRLSSPSPQLTFIFLELKQKITLNAHTRNTKVTYQVTVINKQSIL